ncbi:AMP-binding protein [Nocardia uniformis]|uniref:AMP-binding protein n=1 Tax=Nocardia uniformis TaxID=53432 RepID=A0A849C5W2_9NOCA|nr:AMP-binding protein [Nocardia uniformis]NNH68361.1 AMP-binding protein [Nocardia uniformis]
MLWDAISSAVTPRTVLHLPTEGQSIPVSRILRDAETAAAIIDGDRRVGVLMTNGEPWLRGLLACLRTGAAAVPIALPGAFGSGGAYLNHLRRIIDDAELDTLLVDDSGTRLLKRLDGDLTGVRIRDITEAVDPDALRRTRTRGPDEFAVIQYTSGSTSAPKGVALTAANIVAGLEVIADAAAWTGEDCMGLWLPLFHDMGLFATLVSLVHGTPVCLWRPADFARDPRRWLNECAASPTTAVPMPDFGYRTLATAFRDGVPAEMDLSRWRLAFNGAEPVQMETIREFTEVFAPNGFRPAAMRPCYGMAEATLMVTCQAPGSLPRALTVDRFRLGPGDTARSVPENSDAARTVVSAGRAAGQMRWRVGESGRVGEIEVSGAAVMGGYLGVPDAGQPFTGDGWLRTGDLGFEHGGELYIVGRGKNMMIQHGQNYYAEDIEEIVRRFPDADTGRCAAIGITGPEAEYIAVLLETPLAPEAADDLAADVESAIRAALGPDIARVYPVAPKTIPYTSSGKVRRQAARELCCRITEEGALA